MSNINIFICFNIHKGPVVECNNQTYCFTVWKTNGNGTDVIKRRGMHFESLISLWNTIF